MGCFVCCLIELVEDDLMATVGKTVSRNSLFSKVANNEIPESLKNLFPRNFCSCFAELGTKVKQTLALLPRQHLGLELSLRFLEISSY